MVSFDDEGCKLDVQQGILSLSKGTSITIKSQNGEKITGVRLVVTNTDKDITYDAKRNKPEMFSCDNGEFNNGIWKGSSETITFQSLGNCTIAGIRTSFSTDQKEAYAYGKYEWERVVYNGWYYDDLSVPELVFCFDEKRNLHDSFYDDEDNYDPLGILKTYTIEDNKEYPEWYGDSINIITFDPSFADYHPKRTSHWFDGLYCIIDSLQFLNTTYVEDMSYMFANYHYYNIDSDSDDFPIEDYDYYETCKQNSYLAPESFFSSIFEIMDFSNVKDMNHMFSNCNIYSIKISSPNIPYTANLSGIFENSIVNYITLDTKSINLRNGIFDGVGLGNGVQPCVIDAPEGFYFGVDTSTENFLWKGGCFKGYQLQAYVAVEKCSNYVDAGDMGHEYNEYNDNYLITFYFDKRRYVREKLKYSYSGYDTSLDHGHNHHYGSYITYTYNLAEWEDNKPRYLFEEAKDTLDYDIEITNHLATTIRFDKSFAQYRPKSTRKWFELTENKGEVTYGWNQDVFMLICGIGTAVTKIEGLEYLNTSETTNTERMFYGLCCLDSLDLSNLTFSKVTNSKDMFGACYSLSNLNVNSTLNLDQDTYIDEYGNCAYYIMYEDNIIFFFDDKYNERNGQHIEDDDRLKIEKINGSNCYLSWNSYDGKHAIIDPSFAQRPAGKTVGWFNNSSTLETVQGMENLHSTNMSGMFYGCSNLKSIDLTYIILP